MRVVPTARIMPAAVMPVEHASQPKEPLEYTVPPTVANAPAAMPAARLTNYVFAHSKYSSVMGQNDVLNDLLSAADAEDATAAMRAMDVSVKDTHVFSMMRPLRSRASWLVPCAVMGAMLTAYRSCPGPRTMRASGWRR